MPPYLRNPEVDELKLPSNPEFFVAMKRRASWGDSNAAQNSLVKVSTETGPSGQNGKGNGSRPAKLGANGQPEATVVTESEIGSYLRTLVVRMVVHWNLTDQEGRVLPINEETVELLDIEDGDFLALEAQKRLGVRAEAEQVPFPKNSGQQSMVSGSKTRKS